MSESACGGEGREGQLAQLILSVRDVRDHPYGPTRLDDLIGVIKEEGDEVGGKLPREQRVGSPPLDDRLGGAGEGVGEEAGEEALDPRGVQDFAHGKAELTAALAGGDEGEEIGRLNQVGEDDAEDVAAGFEKEGGAAGGGAGVAS
ncbi:MAG: hypothetical protein SGPRY_010169 [Prymnesium sp.]